MPHYVVVVRIITVPSLRAVRTDHAAVSLAAVSGDAALRL